MGFKKVYYSVENKWYDFVERTRLYKVTDKIDKFMPSLIFFILLIIMIIAGIFLLLPVIKGTGDIELTFKVMDEYDDPIPLAPVLVTTSEDNYNLRTNENGLTSKIRLPYNTEYMVDIDYAGSDYESYSKNFVAEEAGEINIYLFSIPEEITSTYYFTVVDSQTKMQINKSGRIEFMCSNSNALPPDTLNFTSGNIKVTADSDCQLKAKSIMIEGYVTRNDVLITQDIGTIEFLPSEPIDFEAAYPVYITVLGEDGDPLTGMRAELYTNGIAVYGKSCTTTSGSCTILSVDAGNYILKITDTRAVPEYGLVEESISVSNITSKTINMTKTIAGYIQVKVKKTNNQAIENAEVKLKYGDTIISSGHTTNSNGVVNVPVYDLSKTYRVVATKEGYLVGSASNITASEDIPTSPTVTITLQQITPQTAATVKVRVVDSVTVKGFSHAQVVLYDSTTGFLTDYDSQITNSDGNCTFRVTSGTYYAKAFRGASEGVSEEFEVVIDSSTEEVNVIIPIEVVRTSLNITVVDHYGEPVPRANILIFDKFNSRRTVWGGDLASLDGTFLIPDLVSDSEVYAVISDIADNLGATQSEYIYLKSNITNELKVTLYPKLTSLQKPEIKFLGFFNDAGEKLKGYLRSGAEYKARFLLLIPQDRDGRDEFEEVGAVIRTGSISSVASPYMENDSIYIKSINLPNAEVTKYTQYSSEDGYDGVDDVDTLTEGDAKWAKILFNTIYGSNYANAYTIMANIKIKDTAVYGEGVAINYLGYGYTENNRYEIDPIDDTSSNYIEYKTHKTENFNIGEEQACSDDFCFNLNIINLDEDLREDVVDNYNAAPNQHYKLRFGLINNDEEKLYNINSRLLIKNEDKGLKFSSIKITQPNGQVLTKTAGDNEYEHNISITQFNPHTKILGEVDFIPILKGDRIFSLTFISDQKVIFTKQVAIHVLSDKTFAVKITPKTIPSGKNFNLQVEVKDAITNIEVDKKVFVKVKDRFKKDLLANPVQVGALGIASVNNIPGQEPNNKVYVYVEAQEYETSITELKITDEIFDITPTRLGISLNINTKKTENAKFTIENLSESELIIDSINFMGNDSQIDVIDVQRVNNSLLGFVGTEIPGVDSSEKPGADNYNNKKEIEVSFFTSPRASTLISTRNISSKLVIKLRDKYNKEYIWATELPVTLAVSYEGLMDDSHCMTLSEESWETTVVDKYVEKQFTFKNNCGVNSKPVPLNGGLAAKVEFDGSPLGVFSVNVGNRLVELSHGYFKNIYDSVDAEKQHNVVLKYTPVGRFTGDIKGKIIFRSLNDTGSGAQELISEYKFVLHVISLKDCYSVSKKVLTAKDTGEPDSFVIENKGCGSETTYRLSCDDCSGLVLSPKENIVVPATGTSEEIKVMSVGAMPGIYLLNVYSKVSNARGSERNIGKIRVEVRPTTQCIDLDRYEYDLYRYEFSENTGNPTKAKSYDTGNIINKCYGQDVNVQGRLEKNALWQMALLNGLRDGLFTYGISSLVKNAGKIADFFKGLASKLDDALNRDISKFSPQERTAQFSKDLDGIKSQLQTLKTKASNMKGNKDKDKFKAELNKEYKKYISLKEKYRDVLGDSDILNKTGEVDDLFIEIENILEGEVVNKSTSVGSSQNSIAPLPPKIILDTATNKVTITNIDRDTKSELFYLILDGVYVYPNYDNRSWAKYTDELSLDKGQTIFAIACKPNTIKDNKNCSTLEKISASLPSVQDGVNMSDADESRDAAEIAFSKPTIEIKDGKIIIDYSVPVGVINEPDLKIGYKFSDDCPNTYSGEDMFLEYTDPIEIKDVHVSKTIIATAGTKTDDKILMKSGAKCKSISQTDIVNKSDTDTIPQTPDNGEEATPEPIQSTGYPLITTNTGKPCSTVSNMSVNQWACVCTIYKGKKSVVAAKCIKGKTLSLYSKTLCSDKAECKNSTPINATGLKGIGCYNESIEKCLVKK